MRHFYKKLYFNPGIEIEQRDYWKHSASIDFDHIQATENDTEDRAPMRKRTISVIGRPPHT